MVGAVVWLGAPWAARAASLQAGSLQVALEAIDGCLPRLNPDVDVGYDRVVARCPVLARRFEESGVSAWLPRDWRRPGKDRKSVV